MGPQERHDEVRAGKLHKGNILDNAEASSELSHMQIIPLQEDADIDYEPSEGLR